MVGVVALMSLYSSNAAPPSVPATGASPLTAEQLDQLVAPIALYPDPLIAQILMAATYPLEVVEADRWLQMPANAALKGDALTAALQQQPWDPSIKSLVPFQQLLGPLIARARAAGYRPGTPHLKPRPYYGYYFRILTQQGQNAPGAARNYIVNDHMTGGFALIAYPATYADSGIMTFIVNQDSIVFQKNLGPDTANIARQITQYDPDPTWQASEP